MSDVTYPEKSYQCPSPCGVSAYWLLYFGFLLLLTTSACKGCEPPISETYSGQLVFEPSPISFNEVPIGSSEEVPVHLKNIGSEELRIYAVKLEPTEEGGDVGGLRLEGINDPEFSISPDGTFEFRVVYTPTVDHPAPNAHLLVQSSDPSYNETHLKIPIVTVENQARVSITPDPLRFSRTQPGERKRKTITLRNYGTVPIALTNIPNYTGGADFKVAKTNYGSLTEVDAALPIQILPYDEVAASSANQSKQYEFLVEVEYAPLGNVEDSGAVEFTYRALNATESVVSSVDVMATSSGSCIFVEPLTRNMGQVPIGKSGLDLVRITNCGELPLEVSQISLTKNSDDDEFELSLSSYPVTKDGALAAPFTIPPGQQSKPIEVKYTPLREGTDTAEIVIESNDSYQPKLKLDVIARGSSGECPQVNVGGYVEGVSTQPQASVPAKPLDYVILDASASSDPDGRIVEWHWELLSKPVGGSSAIEPLAGDPTDSDMSKRRYRPLVAGTYEFQLEVIDNEGFKSCNVGKVTIIATPSKKIHVELTWTNPEDPDESDTVGSDVDLHMVKMGPGKWFTPPYDIYFRNKNTTWNPETPTLDIDDRDGAGPENIQLDNPGNCEWYAVGIDYYKQLYGTAYATVRIYINQKQVYETTLLPLATSGDFYDVARIHWSGNQGTVIGIEQLYKVRPVGVKPEVTQDMKVKNDAGKFVYCTEQKLYE